MGNVFYELLCLDYDISSVTADEKASLENAIDSNVHATLINAKAIAEEAGFSNPSAITEKELEGLTSEERRKNILKNNLYNKKG